MLHFLGLRRGAVRTGLDVGFTNSWASQTFRQTGGYWMTVEMTHQRLGRVAGALGEDTVLAAGKGGELPFDDKQFDVVVVSCAMLTANPATVPAILRECHRIIKVGGHLVFTVTRQKLHASALSGAGAGYSEAEMFRLLRDGFDVLGFRYSCRFWVQMVRRWELRHNDPSAAPGLGTRLFYTLAKCIDLFLFFTKGYQMTVFCHRKGWRERRSSLIPSAAPVSEAILCDPRRNGKSIAAIRFK
ncbi:MAG: methyltransferase domain-containing protein [Kiritimatiellaeota bacterium]|nr:methyltransferase domain-containing protein [Kiritimatiellota bacterium]